MRAAPVRHAGLGQGAADPRRRRRPGVVARRPPRPRRPTRIGSRRSPPTIAGPRRAGPLPRADRRACSAGTSSRAACAFDADGHAERRDEAAQDDLRRARRAGRGAPRRGAGVRRARGPAAARRASRWRGRSTWSPTRRSTCRGSSTRPRPSATRCRRWPGRRSGSAPTEAQGRRARAPARSRSAFPQMPARYRSARLRAAGLIAPPRDRVGERALERDLRLPAGGGAQPAGVAAHLHHLVRAHERRVDLVLARRASRPARAADAVRPEQTL